MKLLNERVPFAGGSTISQAVVVTIIFPVSLSSLRKDFTQFLGSDYQKKLFLVIKGKIFLSKITYLVQSNNIFYTLRLLASR